MDRYETASSSPIRRSSPSWSEDIWRRLCVWFPFLAGRDFQSRQATYMARDYRHSGVWSIVLPKQCWQSGKTDNLLPRTYEFDVRAFESPVPILIGIASAVFVLVLLAMIVTSWAGNFLFIALLAVLAGGALLFARSRSEGLEIRLWSRPEHMDDLRRPDVVIHEEVLTVFLPTEHLAIAARELVVAERRAAHKYTDPDAPPLDREPPPLADEPPPPPRGEFKREQLPPIKFDE